MQLDATMFSRDAMKVLPATVLHERLRELEALLNDELGGATTLEDFQQRLYALIDSLAKMGHKLWSWDYNCEVELWGGDYMDPSTPDELILKSTYPSGVQLRWGDGSDLW